MPARPIRRIHNYSYESYIEYESSSNGKHEFIDGEIYAMAGGTARHAVLSVNVSSAIAVQLRGSPCVVASSDLKIRVMATGLTSYPDATVICGAPELDPLGRGQVILNPTLVVEVLSDSTEDWDRGEKLENYKRIPSLRECVLVSHRERRIEIVRRTAGDTWISETAGPGQTLTLTSVPVPCALAVDEIYGNVDAL